MLCKVLSAVQTYVSLSPMVSPSFFCRILLLFFCCSLVRGEDRSFLDDKDFADGFLATPVKISRSMPLEDFTSLKPKGSAPAEKPIWELSQWLSYQGLTAADYRWTGSEHRWKNGYIGLGYTPDPSPVIRLDVDTLAIYNELPVSYEKMAHRRPHFLLARMFFPDQNGARVLRDDDKTKLAHRLSTFPNLDSFERLEFSVDLTLEQAEQLEAEYEGDAPEKVRRGYNRDPFCRDETSPDFGTFFWVGWRAYNSDYPTLSEAHIRTDRVESDGTNFAFLMSPKTMLGDDFERDNFYFYNGEKTRFQFDVLKQVERAIDAIIKKDGAFAHHKGNLSGLTIASMNMGWEPASPFRGTMAIERIRLDGTLKE